MTTVRQIHGMMLEEAVLYLLGASGYQTIESAGDDPTLHDGKSGLEVRGRGGTHQVDAIADHRIGLPFSYPPRLLVEAKCYTTKPVGLEIVRNAVGVFKDVGEYWPGRESRLTTRFHYQYAVFSASRFSSDAERYAFAQDIYLVPLAKSRFLAPVLRSIRDVTFEDSRAHDPDGIKVGLSDLRAAVRESLRDGSVTRLDSTISDKARAQIDLFCKETRKIGGALLGMIARRFPVFLVPEPEIKLGDLGAEHTVQIHWDEAGWYLDSRGRRLFSFDLPVELFQHYANEHGRLTAGAAANMKASYMQEIQATLTVEEQVRLVTFHLDIDWLEQVQQRIREGEDAPATDSGIGGWSRGY